MSSASDSEPKSTTRREICVLYIHGLVVVCNDASADLFVHRAADIGGFYYFFLPPIYFCAEVCGLGLDGRPAKRALA